MVYVSADRQFDEQIRVQVYDGRYWSAVNTIVMSNIERPNAGSDRMIETMQLEFIPGLEIVDKVPAILLDSGSTARGSNWPRTRFTR
jgi:hypothetical protein